MTLRLFITGTDTDIGKTYISCGLLRLFTSKNITNIGIKPIFCGGIDAEVLRENSSIKLVGANNYACNFNEELAPHIAATINDIDLSVDLIMKALEPALRIRSQVVVIEGAGGWLVPLNTSESMADLAVALDAKIILVVGMKLGCLNHALLSYHAIISKGSVLAGWVANCLDSKMDKIEENITFLQNSIRAPLLGVVPFAGKPEHYLKIESLL